MSKSGNFVVEYSFGYFCCALVKTNLQLLASFLVFKLSVKK